MTYVKDPFGRELFVNFDKMWVGFEDKLDKLTKVRSELNRNTANYPPYNIKKTGTNTYAIEIAVAGFSKDEIDIELNEGTLTIRGIESSNKNTDGYIFKGISSRAFTRTFELDDYIVVNGAEFVNGMLCVFLERVVPENLKPKKIEIKDSVTQIGTSTKQLLAE